MRTRIFLLLLLSPAVLGLMLARCPEGWVSYASNGQCYYVHSYGHEMTFADARIYCQARGGDLAYIDSSSLRDWLGQLVAASGNVEQNSYLWVGAHNIGGEWKWVETDQDVDNEMLPWDDYGSGDCAALTHNSKLHKEDCSQMLKFICHRDIQIPLACDYTTGWEDASDRCYKKSRQSNSWHDSEVECVIEGGHLASIESDVEQMLAHDLALQEYDKVWIGYTEENHPGVFEWVDGSTSNKTYWNEGQPDLSLNGFGAAVVDNEGSSGLWVVEKITNEFHSLCEKPVGSCLPGWEEFESSCYYFNTEDTDKLVWEDAKSTCESVNAKMVVLDTDVEDTFFRTRMPEDDTLWIGLYSKPGVGMYWTDETSMSSKNYTHMTSEDENSAVGNTMKQCVYLQETIDTDGVTVVSSWVPSDCTLPQHYACEAEVGAELNLITPSTDRYCPDGGWLLQDEHCYFFSAEEKSWPTAEIACKNKYKTAHLVSILTWAEQDFVFNNMKAEGWIGLNDRDEIYVWKWIDGRSVTINNWYYGQPQGDSSNCAEMQSYSGQWDDKPCSELKAYACKMPASTTPIGTVTTTTAIPDTSACGYDWKENPDTGECYRIEVQEMSFYDAKLHCNNLHYYEGQTQPDLVSIYSAAEQNYVVGLLAAEHLSQSEVWIGMINDMSFNKWTDGTPVAYYNFEEGEPYSYYYNQCVEMYLSTGTWSDAECYERQIFICEKKGKNYVGLQPPSRPDYQCSDGWTSFDKHCYYFSSDKTDWFTADTNCKNMMGSYLTSITNEDENIFVKGVLLSMGVRGWLGLRDDDNGENWHWVDGSLYDWTNWAPGEPSNSQNEQHCAEMRAIDYYYGDRWYDIDCSEQIHYVCKTNTVTCPDTWTYKNGKCYYVSDSEATRNEGQVKCQEVNRKASLVNIHSEEENQLFNELLKQSSSSCWMGLQYNGSYWVWADDTVMEYKNWNDGEPSNMEAKSCVEMIDFPDGDNDGKWNNLACSESRAYGCEFYPTHFIACEDDWDAFGDYCYWNSYKDSRLLTHDQAQEYCVSVGANLASIHSAEENDFVYSLITDYLGDAYIGLSDIGHKDVLTWDDGTEVVYTNLKSFSAYYSAIDVCFYYYSVSSPTWFHTSCDDSLYFFCKKPKEVVELSPDTHGCQEGDAYHGLSCYNFPGTVDTWDNAKSDCESRGQHLVVLNNRFETAYISALVGELEHRAWLGMSGTIEVDGSVTFTWVTGEVPEYTYWDKYEPDPEQGTCVSASGDKSYPGLWATRSCSDNYHYFCEYGRTGYTTAGPPTTKAPSEYCLYGWEHIGTRCYKVMQDAAMWGTGEAKCVLFGAHLVSVESEAEENVLKTLPGMTEVVSQYGNLWVGLVMGSDETGYEWTDGSPVIRVNWAEGQPESYEGRESCVSADSTTFKLSDSVCLTHLPFICEAAVGTMITTVVPPTKPPTEACSDDSSWYLYKGHCYKFVSSVDEVGQTWWGAHKKCREDGGELASILSNEENYWIESMIFEGAKLSMWVGGRAKLGTGYEWIDGEPFIYDNWEAGEPNNVNDQEDCISMYTNNYGYWKDQNCGLTAGRICKRPHGSTNPPVKTTEAPDGHCPEGWIHTGTKCVYFIMDMLNFTIARKVCQKMGSNTDLASIHSAAEQAYLTAAMVTLNQHMWLGMRYDSTFMWVDQTSVTYTNWGPNEPNGDQGEEECVEVISETGMWNDVTCSNVYGAICMMTQDPSLPDHHTLNNCPEPHDAYTYYDGACYRAVDTPQTWEEAEATCTGEEAHLVSMVSTADESFVWVIGQEYAFSSVWMGLTSKQNLDTFVWSDGWPTIYTNWGRGEPTLNLSRCVTMDVVDGTWYTKKCDDTFPFICKYTNETVPTPDPPITGYCPDSRWKDLNGGYCYLFSDNMKSWDEANRVCIQEMSAMASIHSPEEMKLIKLSMASYNDPIWIGLVEYASGGQGWSDESGVNYFNWQNGEPNSDEEQCTEVIPSTGKWNDVNCNVDRYYLCKTKKTQEATSIHPVKPTTGNPGDGNGGNKPKGLSGGGIAGIVIAVLFVFSVAGFVGYTYVKKKKGTRDPERPQNSFENTVFDEAS